MSSPEYEPEFLNNDSRRNVVSLADFHDWEKNGDNYALGLETGEYLSELGETYNAEHEWIMGDVASLDGLNGLLDGSEHFDLVRVIDGDEDLRKIDKNGESRKGWRRSINIEDDKDQPLNVAANYVLEGERFSWQPFDYPIWAEHEPRNPKKADERLFNIEPDLRGMDYEPEDIPEEFEEPVFATSAHSHKPVETIIWNSAVSKQGSYRNTYETQQPVPDRSVHIYSFGPDEIDTLHIDVENNEVFEHVNYTLEDGRFNKTLEHSREDRELSPLERYSDLSDKALEQVRDTERFRDKTRYQSLTQAD